MHEDHENTRRDGRLPDAVWERIGPLLPPRTPHPLGGHRPRVAERQALEALCSVRRTGCQWHARPEPGICARSAAQRRCHAWTAAGVCLALWKRGLGAYDAVPEMDWEGRAMAGAMTQAPLGGEQGGPASARAREARRSAPRPRRGGGPSACLPEGAGAERESARQAAGTDPSPAPRDVRGQRRGRCRGPRRARRIRVHRPPPSAGGRGPSADAGHRVPGAAVGRGAPAAVDESLPARADPLGQDRAQLLGGSSFGLGLYHV
jgi:transposase